MTTDDLFDHLVEQYGMGREESLQSSVHLANQGKDVGFLFNFVEGMRIVNTFEAHILLYHAKSFGKQTELKLRLFETCFIDSKDVFDRNILLNVWEDLGLDGTQAVLVLGDPAVRERVKAEEDDLRENGVSTVPTMFFNNETKFIGAQPIDSYKDFLVELVT